MTPSERTGFAALATVTQSLASLLPLSPTRIVLPLAIGNHVDHVEALIASTDWVLAHGFADRVWFYEDFYALSAPMASHAATSSAWRLA